MFEHTLNEEIFSNIQSKPHWHRLMLCPLVLSPVTWEETDPHLSTTPAATAASSGEHSDTLSPCARSQSNTPAVMVGFGPASFSARGCRSQRRSGLRTSPACLSPEGTSSRGSLGTGAAEGGGRCPPPRQQGVPGDAPGATPEVSRRAPRAAEGAGRAPGRALPKGRRRGQTERVGCAGGAGRQRSIPPTLHPSLPSSAGLEPPLGSAPSSSPLGNAGPSPSSRFRWQELGPCPALPPPLPQHSAPSGPAQGRAGETRPRGGRGAAGTCGPFPALGQGKWQERGGPGRGCRGLPVTGVAGCRPGRGRCWGAAGSRRDGAAGGS